MELSKNDLKKIQSLQLKKNRLSHQLFVVEGAKAVDEFMDSKFQLEMLVVSKNAYEIILERYKNHEKVRWSDSHGLQKISSLKTAPEIVAVYKLPQPDHGNNLRQGAGLVLALDNIQDPGNLGTIIRLADWFGFEKIYCSHDCVDCYNTKVVQSSMGSLARVEVDYVDLVKLMNGARESGFPIFGAAMEGEDLYQTELSKDMLLVMGNEGHGLSEDVNKMIQHFITIPKHDNSSTESLNVGIATSIICSEYFRKHYSK